jgi:hypothetical protein
VQRLLRAIAAPDTTGYITVTHTRHSNKRRHKATGGNGEVGMGGVKGGGELSALLGEGERWEREER